MSNPTKQPDPEALRLKQELQTAGAELNDARHELFAAQLKADMAEKAFKQASQNLHEYENPLLFLVTKSSFAIHEKIQIHRR